MATINHLDLRIGNRIVEGKKTIRVTTLERYPECMCRGTHVNGDSCYTSPEVRIK